MVQHTHPQQHQGNGVLVGGGDTGTFTPGDRLIQADVPVETLLGVANGAISGALVSSVVSAVVTAGRDGSRNLFQNTMRNISGGHLVGVLAGTTAIAGLSGLIRFSRATKHNEWSEKHYDFLRDSQQPHAARITTQRDEAKDEALGR